MSVTTPPQDAGQNVPILLFGDGASSGNPGPGGWGCILVYGPAQGAQSQQVRELGGGQPGTTNNRMELTAVISGLRAILTDGIPGDPLRVYTDSTYLIRGITQWLHGWKRNGWKTSEGGNVLNRDLWEELEALTLELRSRGRKLEWNHLPGHSGIAGNERADEIAVQFTKGLKPDLYRGALSDYGVGILEIPSREELSRPEQPYYVSCVDGAVSRHASWSECEARVKGKPGARYKKVRSAREEREALKGWGIR